VIFYAGHTDMPRSQLMASTPMPALLTNLTGTDISAARWRSRRILTNQLSPEWRLLAVMRQMCTGAKRCESLSEAYTGQPNRASRINHTEVHRHVRVTCPPYVSSSSDVTVLRSTKGSIPSKYQVTYIAAISQMLHMHEGLSPPILSPPIIL
jgi:hypothetical protein